MELYRPLRDGGDDEESSDFGVRNAELGLEEWLDFLMHRRELAIQELRWCDAQLVRHGRIRAATLPKRVR